MATPLLKSSIWAGLCGCALHSSVGVGAFEVVMQKARKQAHRRQRGKVLAKGRLLNGKMGKKVEVADDAASEENCEWRKAVYAATCCSCREDADKKNGHCEGIYNTTSPAYSPACAQMLQEADDQKHCPWAPAREGIIVPFFLLHDRLCKKRMPTTATATTTKFYDAASEENCEWRKAVYAATCCSCREDDRKNGHCEDMYKTSPACAQMLQEADDQKHCPWAPAREGIILPKFLLHDRLCKKRMPTIGTATTTKSYSCDRRKAIFIQKCCHCTEESAGKGQCFGETRKMPTCEIDLMSAVLHMKCDWAKFNIRVDHCKELAPIGPKPSPDCPSC